MQQQEGWSSSGAAKPQGMYGIRRVSGHKYRRTARAKAKLLNLRARQGSRFYADESPRGPLPWAVYEHRVVVR